MKAIIKGRTGPIQQPTEFNYDPTRGLYVVERWESAGDTLQGLAATYAALRVPYQYTSSPVKSTLVGTISGAQTGQGDPAQTITDTWQIKANEIQKDIREHWRSAGIDDDELVRINKAINDNTKPAGTLSDYGLAMYNLLKRGATHFPVGQYVLCHTTSVWNGYTANVSDVNVGKIYTTPQLITECANPSFWTYPIPARLQFKLSNLAAPVAKPLYLWGWRKLPSTETTAAGNRIEIATEYWLEQWSTFVYDAV